MSCPLKPGITCEGTPELASSTPCPGCTAGRVSGRSRRSLRLCEPPSQDYFAILREKLRERLPPNKNFERKSTIGGERR